MKTVILDDELGSIQTLEALLNVHCPEVSLLQTFQRPADALLAIPALSPDLVFLDIQMPGLDGFAFLEQLDRLKVHPEIIFTTAYGYHKSRSHQYAALDFLIKPIETESLREAVMRAIAFVERNERATRAAVFLQNRHQVKPLDKSLVLPGKERSLIVRQADIVRLEADGPYTRFFITDKKTTIISRSLGYWESVLSGAELPFFRVHESHLVSFVHIAALLSQDGGVVEMKDGTKIPIARRRKEEFQQWVKGYTI